MSAIRFIWSLGLILIFSGASMNAGSQRSARIDFYGHEVNLIYDIALHHLDFHHMNQSELDRQFRQFRNKSLKQAAVQLQELKKRYRLDDIGISLLIDKFADQQFSAKQENLKVFVKYLMLKELDYDVLLTRTNGKLNCMANMSFVPGRYIYISYNRKTYKDLDFEKRVQRGRHFIVMDRVKTYRVMSRNATTLPRLNAKTQSKDIQFKHANVNYEMTARSNESILEFLEDMPMYDIGKEYTRLSMSSAMKSSLIAELKTKTQEMNAVEKAQFLLAFVQQAVPYGSDYTKYGEERYYYPEQTIMASTADCEDKTFLLSYLLREIAHLQSVALYFENDEHLSIGVLIPNYEDSYSFKYKGKYYVACEPTAQYPRLGRSAFDLNRVTQVTPL